MRRQEYVMMRILRGVAQERWWEPTAAGFFGIGEGADFLIAPQPYRGFRKPDHVCRCRAPKHKDKAVTDACPVLKRILGAERSAVYFALPEGRPLKFGKQKTRETKK